MLRGLALCAILAAFPGSAWAQQVFALRVEAPGFPDALTKALDKAMRDEINSIIAPKGRLLPTPALDFDGLQKSFGCPADVNPCLVVIARTVSAARIVRVLVSGDVATAKVNVTLVEIGGKTELASGEITDLMVDTAGDIRPIVAQAFGIHRESPSGGLQLYVASDVGRLEGADLLLDEKKVPAAELTTVKAGKHRLEVRQKGFEPFIWVGAVRPGQETRVGVNLVPIKGADILTQPTAVLSKPSPSPSPSPSAPPQIAEVAPPRAGPNYVLPAVLGAVAIGAGIFATIEGVRVNNFESSETQKCNLDPSKCVPDACAAFPDECKDARSAATMATVGWVAAGVLAGGAITAYLIETFAGHSGSEGSPKSPAKAGALLEF
ncbi:MAG: hypothetical protein U1E65_12850 [Myxococcota bacterium]